MDALSKQGRLLQELVELEADKVELMQLDWWVSEDKEDKEEEEVEEGEEVYRGGKGVAGVGKRKGGEQR